MKAPVLNLHRANRPGAAPGMLALVAAIIVLVATMQYLDTLKQQGAALDERETAIAKHEAKFKEISNAHRSGNDPRAAQLMAQQRYAAEPARDLIEGGWHPNIALLSLDIVTASRQINLQFETRSAQEALSYADWFQAQPGTESVAIKRQSEKAGPPAKSVETALQVTWRPFVAQPVASAASESAAASVPASAPPVASASAPASAPPVAASSAKPPVAHGSGGRR